MTLEENAIRAKLVVVAKGATGGTSTTINTLTYNGYILKV